MKESVQIEWLAVVCAREKGAAHVAVEKLRPSTLRREHVAVERQLNIRTITNAEDKHKRRRAAHALHASTPCTRCGRAFCASWAQTMKLVEPPSMDLKGTAYRRTLEEASDPKGSLHHHLGHHVDDQGDGDLSCYHEDVNLRLRSGSCEPSQAAKRGARRATRDPHAVTSPPP